MGMAGECTPGHVVIRDREALADALGGAAGTNGLVAVVDEDAESWLGDHHQLTATTDSVGIVSIGERVRSTAAASPQQTATLPDVSGVSDASEIGEIGRLTADYISKFADQGATPVVVFDAVDAVVDAAGVEATFRVLHLLGARTTGVGGRLVTVLPESLQRDEAETLAALAD